MGVFYLLFAFVLLRFLSEHIHDVSAAGKPYAVEDAREQKTCELITLAGVDSVEAAARLRDVVVEIDRDDAERLKNAMERANTIQRIIH